MVTSPSHADAQESFCDAATRVGDTLNGRIVIGVDGGGTSLRLAVATETGELLGVGLAGSGNFHDVGIDKFQANLQQAYSRAQALEEAPSPRADAIFLGLGSVATEEDRAAIRGAVRELSLAPEDRIGVDHDLRVAWMGCLAGQAGIVLIAGTGTACYGRDDRGNSWQAGGWGHVLDDPGSSYWLGRQAMTAAVRDFDGRGAATVLRARVKETLGLADIRHILRRVDLKGMTRSEVAALARLVTEAATEGDAVARGIIDRGANELAKMVTAVAKNLGLADMARQVPVSVTGGLTNAGDVFMDPLRKAIEDHLPQAVFTKPELPPVLGAVMLAIESLGIPVTSKIVASLRESQGALLQVSGAT